MFHRLRSRVKKMKEGRMSSELPYESRYFSVLLDMKGKCSQQITGKIARIDTSDAVEYAKQVLKSGKERGFFGGVSICCSEFRFRSESDFSGLQQKSFYVSEFYCHSSRGSPPPVFWQYLS